MNKLKNKKVLVVGMGKSGVAAVQALIKLGAKVYVQDSKPKEEVNPQLIAFLEEKIEKMYFAEAPAADEVFDILVLSPGVSPNIEFIEQAKKNGAEIIGELEIAYRVGKGNYVAITGTNGKTTTTTLVGQIFRNAGRNTYVVGNIGVAVISKALNAEDDEWLVTETSSFQLETIKYFKPRISAILNITPDHMDRHGNITKYGAAKARVFENQGKDDYFIVNYDDKHLYKYAEKCKARVIPFSRMEELPLGVFVKGKNIVVRNLKGEIITICDKSQLQIPGAHNLENALAAVAISYFAGIDPGIIAETLVNFLGVEHRMEFCGEIEGVRYVNDSKGTNPDASIKAIEAIDGSIILIAGGYDKGSTFEEFIGAFNGKIKTLILLGKTAGKIKETAEKMGFVNIIMAKDMEECVREAVKVSTPGDTVLLSPACASWDMYDCFEQRGEHFKRCVSGLEQ
ncbi:MAG TPA: UDP-N-acetylmuramoyl-L-alanine--D-glutamate ligase [Anaerovoracaceae bacterium]|nr:UDP-N-acetylmuramoyl-L-alanine--D-glutamate ligase [Anaerovoracaceae bacterium]